MIVEKQVKVSIVCTTIELGSDIVDSDYPLLGQTRYEVVKCKVYRKSKRGSKYVQATSGIFSIKIILCL